MIDRIRNLLRREQPHDAFGGDELYDGDTPPAPIGRRIALAVSGALFLLMVGLGVAVYIAGKDAPPPAEVIAPLAGLQVEDDDATAAAPPAATPTPPAVAGAKPAAPPPAATKTPPGPAPMADATEATDRSADRRPWLSAPAVQKPATPAAPAAPVAAAPPPPPAKAPPAPPRPATPPPAPPASAALTPPAPATPMPPVTKITPPAAVAAAPVAPPGVMPSILSATPATPDATPTADADATPADIAPGAPDRFVEQGDLSAGGRPRLVEPPLPPVDKASMSAPPPRFGNIAPIKVKATATPDKAGKMGKVAVIVQGLGLSQDTTEAAVTKLPTAVALSFSPYAHDLPKWLKMAKDSGHEVLVEVPMESKEFPAEDPGPLGLMTAAEPKENAERLKTILKTFPSAIGIDDIMGSKFRESDAPMRDVFTALKQANLIYVQGRPGVRIGEPGVPNTIADIVVDERPFRAAIDARLDYAERLAKFQGSAVTVMSAKPVSFERLALWLGEIDKHGIELTPVSKVLVQVATK